jgi:hypothetical protein
VKIDDAPGFVGNGGRNPDSAAAGALIGAFGSANRAQLIRAVWGLLGVRAARVRLGSVWGFGSEKERYANRGTALILPCPPSGVPELEVIMAIRLRKLRL